MAKLYFYYSTMNAGKSTLLLQSRYNYEERGMKTLVFKPAVDTRAGHSKIASRIGLEHDAIVATPTFDFFEYMKKYGSTDCIFVDEAQFLSKMQVQQLCQVVDQLNIPILAYGLRTDFQGELFEGSHYLMAWADKLQEVKTICHCGSKATMVVRLDANGERVKDGPQVQIGGNESYTSLCRKHFYETPASEKTLEKASEALA